MGLRIITATSQLTSHLAIEADRLLVWYLERKLVEKIGPIQKGDSVVEFENNRDFERIAINGFDLIRTRGTEKWQEVTDE